jgi:uncharacterized protein
VSIGMQDFIVGVGILLMVEGLLFSAIPSRMRSAMESVLTSPDSMLRVIGLASAIAGLILIWLIRH